tara:strand:+ start:1476 stop:2327 length:852 start_codon:yes stop_codon:yes gene_type:complete
MPTHLGHEAITAKLGHADPSMYLGHEQIYPNNVSINSFAFTNTSTVAVTGATRVLNVGGEIGSTFNLVGSGGASSPGNNLVLSSSPQSYNITIPSNYTCGASAKTPTVTITPTGNTVLAGGVPTSRSLSQTAGPSITYVTPSVKTISVTEVTSVTTTIGGQLRWAPGAQFSATVSVTSTVSMPVYVRVYANCYTGNSWASGSGWTGTGTLISTVLPAGGAPYNYQNNNQASWSETTPTLTLGSGNPTYVRFYAYMYESSGALTCYLIGGSDYLEPSPQYNYPP